jgi:excisionase family DNA binding protein
MNESIKKPRLLTLKQAAALVEGLTEYRVRRMCISGDIKYHKFGNKYMISESEILKFFGVNA